MDRSNPYIAPHSLVSRPDDPGTRWFRSRQARATAIGGVAIACALLGLVAFVGYGMFATRGIDAVHTRDMVSAHRMAAFAGGFSLAQLLLGLLAVGLGWGAIARGGGTALARRLGALGLGIGVLVLLLSFVLV